MNDEKKRLWWADRLRITCFILILLGAMLGQGGSVFGPILVFAVLPCFLIVEFLMNRCPHCGSYLYRNRGSFCQHCGERIRGDKAET